MDKDTDPFAIALNLRGAFGLRDLDEWPRSIVENAADVLETQARELSALRRDMARYRWARIRASGETCRIEGVIFSDGGMGMDAANDRGL